ncbi:MAG: hypothetical protein K0B00_11425 [Rhodobacteraceae bacterium]|nr:hypothetical protein [Paracoccaceae bacterium]
MSPRSDGVRRKFQAVAFAALAGVCVPAMVVAQGSVQAAAFAAVSAGRVDEAASLSRALLEMQPGDAFAHYLLATLALRQGDTAAAAREGKRAFRNAASKVQKHESARLVATAAVLSERPLAARYWLRHAAASAPDPIRRAGAERALAALRAATPWAVQLRFSVQPTNNVNAGAASRLNVIDGLPLTGVLSDDALALPGVAATANLRLSYRLQASDTGQTRLSLQLYGRGVELAGQPMAESLDPSGETVLTEIRGASFSSASAELGLNRSFAGSAAQISVDLAAGRAWSAGAPAFDYLRLSADRSPKAGGVFWGGGVEWRAAPDPRRDQTITSLRGGWQGTLGSAGTLVLGLGLRAVETERANARGRTVSASLRFQPARQIGPAAFAAGLGLSYSDYPDYTLGFIAVPGGRQETLGFAELEVWLPEANIAGFAPTVKLTALETQSNVSSFERRELAVSFGFRSNF